MLPLPGNQILAQQPRRLIVGVGSSHGDDRLGWLVVDRLRSMLDADCRLELATSPSDWLDWLDGVDDLHIVDAYRGGQPGEVCRIDWPDDRVVDVGWCGTHDLPLSATLELAAALGLLPTSIAVWAVAVPNYGHLPWSAADMREVAFNAAACIARQLLPRISGDRHERCRPNDNCRTPFGP